MEAYLLVCWNICIAETIYVAQANAKRASAMSAADERTHTLGGRAILRSSGPGREIPALQASPPLSLGADSHSMTVADMGGDQGTGW